MATVNSNTKSPAKPTIGIVVPLLDEADNLELLVERLVSVLEVSSDYTILFVDDGSTDDSLEIVKSLARSNENIRYLSLTRNFGHQIALKSGLQHCFTDIVISLDADLQHPPEEIPRMIESWRDGYMVVNMIRKDESTSVFKKLTSRLFYKLINGVSDFKIAEGSSDFRLLDKRVVDLIRNLPEHCVFLRGLVPWLGFEQLDLPYSLHDRQKGIAKYRLLRMLQLAATGITSSSIRPLRVAFIIGSVTSMVALAYATYALIVKIFLDTSISGWASLLVGMMLLGGVQLLMLGVVGEYVGRIFLEVKGRPDAIISESNID